ncbi:chromate resistance protein ChrB domain-containing protein [Trinickia sp.]|uniref:chromate resistance protein ChrB domain-containing protein n=1 Tax=Trinickia sp. TaxID=2571163 RepID=UPI003F7E0CC0
MKSLSTWSLLVLTLPTENATARMRIYRSLKAKGCAVLRDGVYLLPYNQVHEDALREVASAIAESGGAAHLLRAPSLDTAQEEEFRTLFDREGDYAVFMGSLAEARKTVSGQSAAELTRLLRRLRKGYDAIEAIDYFPDDAATRAKAAWQDFVALVDTVLSPGEPHASERVIRRLQREDYQGRTWATRRRIWVDRAASAWLIRRFIDTHARFLWLASPDACPDDALGFDFDGAAFTHVDERVTFEVLLASFDLESDPALRRLGAIVHALDIGGPAASEAAGFEAVVAGMRQHIENDDRLLEQVSPVLDALYTQFTANAKEDSRRRS